jgi:hypothetical protein
MLDVTQKKTFFHVTCECRSDEHTAGHMSNDMTTITFILSTLQDYGGESRSKY